jgi:hypothetical protein
MGDAIRAAEARLVARMTRVQAHYAARWRFRSYLLPAGLVAGALLVSFEIHRQPGGALVMSPLLAAAVYARIYGGVTAARVAVSLVMPIAIYEGYQTLALYTPLWSPFLVLALIGLCIERASCARYELGPDRRSAHDPAHMPGAYRAPPPQRPPPSPLDHWGRPVQLP